MYQDSDRMGRLFLEALCVLFLTINCIKELSGNFRIESLKLTLSK